MAGALGVDLDAKDDPEERREAIFDQEAAAGSAGCGGA
jgi:hypothetical protein